MDSSNGAVVAEHTEEKRGAERRIAERLACDGFAEVVVPHKGYLFRGEIADLSETGCFIKTRARLNLKRSAEAELRFTVNGDQLSLLARTAAVRAGVGAGFEFSLIEPAMHQRLLELIEDLKAQAATTQARKR